MKKIIKLIIKIIKKYKNKKMETIKLEIFGQDGGENPPTANWPNNAWTGTAEWLCVFIPEEIPASNDLVYGISTASGETMVAGSNASFSLEELVTGAYSMIGYENIKLQFLQFRQISAPILNILWSLDKITWNNVSFTNSTDNGYWQSVITSELGSGVNNNSQVYFKFTYQGNSGSYLAFDDFKILGETI